MQSRKDCIIHVTVSTMMTNFEKARARRPWRTLGRKLGEVRTSTWRESGPFALLATNARGYRSSITEAVCVHRIDDLSDISRRVSLISGVARPTKYWLVTRVYRAVAACFCSRVRVRVCRKHEGIVIYRRGDKYDNKCIFIKGYQK